jgi:NAD(P)H-flavin reductase
MVAEIPAPPARTSSPSVASLAALGVALALALRTVAMFSQFGVERTDREHLRFLGRHPRLRVGIPNGLRKPGSRSGRVSRIRLGPDPEWQKLTVASIKDVADGIKAIAIQPPPETIKGYTTGGQYVQLRAPGAEKASFIAIASRPRKYAMDLPFEFLVKEQPPSDWSPGTGWLTGAAEGDELEMSQVMGEGFITDPEVMDNITDVMLFAAGSGIAPIRAVIESDTLGKKNKYDIKLFYGARTPKLMSYQDKFEEWEAAGVNVTPVISKPEGTKWDGATGYVQDVAKASGPGKPESTLILMCGMKGMAEGVKELAAEWGVPESNVLTNF